MKNYYNEFDRKAAAWLRELIASGLIPPGDVDERSIIDVQPSDLAGYTQCHFFAGIGGWAYALDRAAWPRDRSVWTGSCPCQPFSAAGQQKGTDDPRHLWPAWFRLIEKCRPAVVFGEQVASPAALLWFDGVCLDLENAGYACAAADLCAAGVGAPQIRQRLYWLACTDGGIARNGELQRSWQHVQRPENGSARGLEHAEGVGLFRGPHDRNEGRRQCASGQGSQVSRLGDPDDPGPQRRGIGGDSPPQLPLGSASLGCWAQYDILECTDGKQRRIEPGSFPLAHGVPGRVGLLRGYGNAIVPEVAAQFIQSFLETENLWPTTT